MVTRRFPSRAFTLLELLAVVSVVGVLVAVLLPALAGARRSARFSSSLTNSRTVVQAVAVYTHDHRGTHPYLLAAEFAHLERPPAPMGPHAGAPPRIQERYWMVALARHSPDIRPLLYPDVAHFPWQWERDEPLGVLSGCFAPTATLFAAPDYFSETKPPRWAHLRPTRTQEIAFPSAKMLVWDWSSVWLNSDRDIEDDARTRMTHAFADGSAIVSPELTAPFVDRSTVYRGGPGFTTVNGLAGRDR